MSGSVVVGFPAKPAARRHGARTRGLGIALVCCGVAVLPWLLVLAGSLPATARVSHWSAAWMGLDVLEALGLVVTGCLLLRRDPRRGLTAASTAALLVADAWIDVTTSTWGTELVTALAMALCVELPLAVVCAALAVRSLPRAAPAAPRPYPGSRSTAVPPPSGIAPRSTTVSARRAPNVADEKAGKVRQSNARERR